MLQSMTPRRYVPPVFDPALRTVHRVTDRFVPEVTRKPESVWTLRAKPANLAAFVPVHGRTAWLEDYIHDWNWYPVHGLKYASSVGDPKATHYETWILCEYAAEVQP